MIETYVDYGFTKNNYIETLPNKLGEEIQSLWNIQAGDYVTAYDAKCTKCLPQKITERNDYYINNPIKLIYESVYVINSLECGLNQLIKIKNVGWLPAQRIEIGMILDFSSYEIKSIEISEKTKVSVRSLKLKDNYDCFIGGALVYSDYRCQAIGYCNKPIKLGYLKC